MSNSQVISRRTLLKGSAIAAAGISAFSLPTFLQMGQALAAEPTDIDILNFALTLEHLEYAFYRDGLKRFSGEKDFDYLRQFGDLETNSAVKYLYLIRDHEEHHVATLTEVIKNLGGVPVGEAEYDFKYNDVFGFVKTAQALENTGVMAYDGAIALLQNPDLQTAGATIATVEARHAAYLNYINNTVPFPAAFDMPKTMAEILAIAGPFIVGQTATGQSNTQSGTGSTPQNTAQDAQASGGTNPTAASGGSNATAVPGATATPGNGGGAATATPGGGVVATVGGVVQTLIPTLLP